MSLSYTLAISRHADMVVARRTAKQLAQQLGFDGNDQELIVLVVSELASNLIKYAGRGQIKLQALFENDQTGLLIESHDKGPGFNVDRALTDGFSSSGSLGIGLGAIQRMVDDMHIDSRQTNNTGTDIICKKWLPGSIRADSHKVCPLEIGIVSKAKQGFELNGDAYVIKNNHQHWLVAVIDGVGHGPQAHKAAFLAKQYVESHVSQSLHGLFHGVEQACQGSNGVVMAIAQFDLTNDQLSFASIGNIEAKLIGRGDMPHLPVRRGILGRHAPLPMICSHSWTAHQGLVMHSDGVSSRWHWRDYPHLQDKPAQLIAEHMHHQLNKDGDDATLLFVKNRV